jgi:WD40 repeat protein
VEAIRVADVLISYSRKDTDFVKSLHAALTQQNQDTWVDWEDIPITADWWREIEAGIDASNAFVFVLSPDSIASKICYQEIEHAVKQNKRLIPIVRRENFDPDQVHPMIGRHNWLYFREQDDFDRAFGQLLQAITTDLDYVRQHTRLLVRAIEWETKTRNDSFLLRGDDLTAAETWLAESATKTPNSTEQQYNYILKSREAEDAYQRLTQAGKRATRLVQSGSIVLGGTLMAATIVSMMTFQAFHKLNIAQGATELEQRSSTALSQFQFSQLDSLVMAIANGKALKSLVKDEPPTEKQPTTAPIYAIRSILSNIREQNQIKAHTGRVLNVNFSPDGQQMVTAGRDGGVAVWSLAGQKVSEFTNHGGVYGANFSPDGQQIVTVTWNGTIARRNLAGRLLAQSVKEIEGGLNRVQFSRDRRRIVTTQKDGIVQVWDLSGKNLLRLKAKQGKLFSANFSPDGQTLITGGADGFVRLWNLKGKPIKAFKAHSDGIFDVSLSPQGNIATAGENGTARLWSATGEQLHQMKGDRVRFSPDGQRLATATNEGTIALWSLDGQAIAEFTNSHIGVIYSLSFSPDGRHLASSGLDKHVRLWNFTEQAGFKAHAGEGYSVSASSDNRTFVTAGEDGATKVWDFSGKRLAQFKSSKKQEVWSVSFSPDGQIVAAGMSDGTIALWDRTGGKIREFRGNLERVLNLRFSPDGQQIVTVGDQGGQLWSLTGQRLAQFKTESGGWDVRFHPNGQTIVTSENDGSVRLWTLKGQQISAFNVNQTSIYSLALSPDGQTIATGGSDGVVEFRKLSGQLIKRLKAHHTSIWGLNFSPDGQQIATASGNSIVRLWDLSGQQLGETKGNKVAFSADGQRLITVSADGKVRWIAIESLDQLIDRGCGWLQNYLAYNPMVNESDRHLCDGISAQK